MSYVLCTLLHINCFSKTLDTFNQFFLGCWLNFTATKFFKFMPLIFYRVAIWWFWRYLLPVDASRLQENLCFLTSMLRIIILHETMTIRIYFFEKWHKSPIQDFNVKWSIHNTFENAYCCTSSEADTCPYVNFNRMFGPVSRTMYKVSKKTSL